MPARFLPHHVAPLWILYWCAARRVDDSIEEHRTTPGDWVERVSSPEGTTLAERCVAELLRAPELQRVDFEALLARSLEGVERERTFDRPRPWADYLDLLDLKSTPTMEIFDALLAPEESPALRTSHARAFAASAQIGDDCRDALQDLRRGRCFVTIEELGDEKHPIAFVQTPTFAQQRANRCRSFLQQAERAAASFRGRDARTGASQLHTFWRQAIDSGQIQPSAEHLALPQ